MTPLFRGLGSTLLLAVIAAPQIANAQVVANDLSTTAQSNFARNDAVAVLDRPHPLYDPLGMDLGDFTLSSSLGIDTVYDDNIYALPTVGPADTIIHIRPDVRLTSDWSGGFVSLDANANLNRFLDYASQDTDDWSVSARGGLEFISNGKLEVDAGSAQLTEPLSAASSVSNQAAPVAYRVDSANVSASQGRNRLKVSFNAAVQRFDYYNAPAIGGGFIDETFRNRTAPTMSGRVDYAVSPNLAVFGEAIGNIRDYDQVDPSTLKSQNAAGYELLSGANFQVTHLLRGELGLGYLNETYANASYGKVSGPGFRNKLQWFPTQLITVTATYARTMEDSGVVGAPTYRLESAALQADYELLRNLILTAQVNYSHAAYVGIARTDERYQASATASYLFNRHLSLNLSYGHLSQRSYGPAAGTPFNENNVRLSLAFRL
jgi:hypothetical protein